MARHFVHPSGSCRPENPTRDAAIVLQALPEPRELIDHAASLLGKKRSDFMLEAARERAQTVVLDQDFFSLDVDKGKPFTAMLDAAPGPNPGLERLWDIKGPGCADTV